MQHRRTWYDSVEISCFPAGPLLCFSSAACCLRNRKFLSRDDRMIALRLYLWSAVTGLARAVPGLLLCAALGLVAMLIATWYGTPILWALFLGMGIAAFAP